MKMQANLWQGRSRNYGNSQTTTTMRGAGKGEGQTILTACLSAGSRDNTSVLIVAFPALGLAFVTLSITLLSELVASKKEGANNIAVVDDVTRALANE
jgi:hypothetical protein